MRSAERVVAPVVRRVLLLVVAAGALGHVLAAPPVPSKSAARRAALSAAVAAKRPAKSSEGSVVQTVDLEYNAPVRIELERFTRATGDAGVFAATLRIDNRSDRPLTWHVTLVGSGFETWQRRDPHQPVSAAFECGPLELNVPAGSAREFPLRIMQPGVPQILRISGPFVANESVSVAQWETTGPLFSLEAWSSANSRPVLSGNILNTTRDPATFPTDWRALELFPGVGLTTEEWAQLSAAQTEAIRNYVAHGGQLELLGAAGSPPFVPEVFGQADGSVSGARQYGFGKIGELTLNFERRPNNGISNNGNFRWIETPPEWLQERLPRLPLYLVLAGTAILAGPVSFLWLARRRGRHWVFLSLPVVAVGATAALLAVILLHDGVGGNGRRLVVAVLSDGRPEMIVRQSQAARCGWLNSREFEIPAEATMSFAAIPGTPGSLNLGREDGHCTGDWFRNRSATAHVITHDVPTRATITWRGTPLHPAVVSTFSGALDDFVVRRADGLWQAARVEPGRETSLEKVTPEKLAALRASFANPLATAAPSLLGEFDTENRFVAHAAQLDGAPIATLSSIRWTDTIIVTGHCVAP